jgi:hypothetical protein
MKVQKSTFKTETACDTKMSESLVEGRLSVPAEKADIGRILMVQGRVHVGAEPGDGKVFMEGNVRFSVVYMGFEGSIDSFESSSPFRHTENMDNAGAGMNVYAKGSVKEIEYTVEDDRTIYVKGVVSMNISGSVPTAHEAVTGADSPDIQVKSLRRRIAGTKNYMKDTAAIREDIRIPQSMPKAEKILYSDAYAVVKSVKTEDLKIIVEGDIKMMVLYLSEDKSAPLQYYYDSLPFGDILASEGASADDAVLADADLYDLNMDVAEESGDIFRLGAKINVMCMINSQNDIEYMEDAYSLKNRLNVKYNDCSYKHAVLSGSVKAFARSAITIPPYEPSVSRIVCMKASPVIVTATPGSDRVYLEGLMMFSICYASPEGMRSYSGEVPFEAEAQMEGLLPSHSVDVTGEVEYCTFEGAGRDISVKFMMDVQIKAFAQNSFKLVSDVEETEEEAPHKKGITIYFADGDETVWDVAKRYSTTLDNVKKFNPDLEENIQQGQKILIMG